MAEKKTKTRSREFSDSVIDTIREPLIALDQKLRVVNASRSFYEFFKVKPEETMGQLIYDLGNRQWDIPKLRELLETILPQKVSFDNYEVEHEFATIGKRTMLLNARQIERVLGKDKIILLAIEDITERKQVEESIRQSEEKYRTILDNIEDGYYEVDLKGNFTFFNDSMYRILGYSKDELMGMNNRQITDKENAKIVFQAFNKVYNTGEPTKEFDWQVIRKDGTKRYIEQSASLKKDSSGKITGFRGIIYDITERKRAEEALRESEQRLKEAQKVAHIGHWELDPKIGKPTWSEEIFHIFGLDPKKNEPSFVDHETHLYPDDWPILKMAVTKASTDGTHFDIQFRIVHPSGEIKWMHSLGTATMDTNGAVSKLFGTAQDITERKRVEAELRTSHLQLRALAGRIQQIREEERARIAREIHDEMGGGLTGLKLDLAWLLRKMDDADKREEYVALIDKIHASNALIDQMISTVRRISTDLRPSVLDDLGLIAALDWQLSEFMHHTEIPNEYTTTCEYVNVEMDTAVAVFRIFQEALTNVARHSGATKVAVVIREGERSLFGDESLVLEIRDNGRGITDEEILSPESLGLLGMKERVLAFGGKLSIYGEPGGGTALILKIPLKQGESS